MQSLYSDSTDELLCGCIIRQIYQYDDCVEIELLGIRSTWLGSRLEKIQIICSDAYSLTAPDEQARIIRSPATERRIESVRFPTEDTLHLVLSSGANISIRYRELRIERSTAI